MVPEKHKLAYRASAFTIMLSRDWYPSQNFVKFSSLESFHVYGIHFVKPKHKQAKKYLLINPKPIHQVLHVILVIFIIIILYWLTD